MPAHSSIDQHLIEIQRNRKAWGKPVLRKAYGTFYRLIQAELARGSGLTVELGLGIGAIRSLSPTVLQPIFFLIRSWTGPRMRTGCLSRIARWQILFFLTYFPGLALREFERVPLAGRLILMEPGFGLLGRFIYQGFHHEPLGFDRPVPWDAPGGFDPDEQRYYAAQANAWQIFVRHEFQPNLAKWRLITARRLAALSYVASGGFSGPSLYPDWFYGGMLFCDEFLGLFPSVFATRLLVVLE